MVETEEERKRRRSEGEREATERETKNMNDKKMLKETEEATIDGTSQTRRLRERSDRKAQTGKHLFPLMQTSIWLQQQGVNKADD